MKFKHLLIVSLILAVLAVGAVSASDVADELAVEDNTDDSIAIEDNNQDLISDDEEPEDPYEDTHLSISSSVNTNNNEVNMGYVENDFTPLNGTITLTIDGTQYYNKYSNSYEQIIGIDGTKLPDSLKSGKHFVVLSYLKNGEKTPYSTNKTVEFTYEPKINYASPISTGQASMINIEGLPGSTGTATLYYYNNYTVGAVVATVPISNGKAQITVNGLAKGDHIFLLNTTFNSQQYSESLYLYVYDNTAGYTATASSELTVGDNAVVTFSGSKTNEWLSIYVDGVFVKDIKYLGGTLSEPISGLTVGQHMIAVRYENGDDFFYKSFNVNVVKKATPTIVKLALKKVKVKQSAKKLSLKATLKINNKVAKSKKITFKFNGKKIVAKTNKKGVATAKIPAKILKKLKAGKKITYAASYGKNTKKVTVKVQK